MNKKDMKLEMIYKSLESICEYANKLINENNGELGEAERLVIELIMCNLIRFSRNRGFYVSDFTKELFSDI